MSLYCNSLLSHNSLYHTLRRAYGMQIPKTRPTAAGIAAVERTGKYLPRVFFWVSVYHVPRFFQFQTEKLSIFWKFPPTFMGQH